MSNPPSPPFFLVDDPLFEQHRSRGYHPERPARLEAARRAVHAQGGEGMFPLPPRDATDEELLRAHTSEHVQLLHRIDGHHAALDADTYVSPVSVAAARRAAGGAIALVDALLDASPREGRAEGSAPCPPGVALLRPPGHHATRERGMGFCLVNNAAIAAYHALARGLERVAIVDFDVHHGNGTQDIFLDDPRVLYVSLHEQPLYPGSGGLGEIGQGAGAGFTVNVPLSSDATDAVYRLAFDGVVVPVLRGFAPELVIVSAGFDAHVRDPLASMRLTHAGYAAMCERLGAVADETAGGRIALLLEGGYDLTAIEVSLSASIRAFTHREERAREGATVSVPETQSLSSAHREEIEAARAIAAKHWPGT